MAMRDWRWPQWLILISLILLLLLGAAVLYVVLTPEAFRPVGVPTEPGIPISGLPPEELGRPEFPPSAVERIPLGEIQGTDILNPPSDIARGGVTTVTSLTNFEASHISLGPDGNSLNYYDPDFNTFFRIDDNGNVLKAGKTVFADVENVTWSSNGSDAIVEFPDGSNVVYNIDTEEQITLPPHWEDFTFSPSGEQIGFKSIALDPSENWLAVSDKSGGSARKIEHLGDNYDIVDVNWSPNNQVVATYSRPTGLSTSDVFFLGLNDENFPLSKVHGLKFEGSWSPSGEKLLYSASHADSDFRPSLWVVDGTGSNVGQGRKQIGLNTWSNKCAFTSDGATLYCGVPTELPRGSGLIPSIADTSNDRLVRVDLQTGATTEIAIPAEQVNVEQIQLNSDGSKLFFKDKFSGELKKINLE